MAEETTETPSKGGIKKIAMMVVPALVVGIGAVLFLGGGDEASATATTIAVVEGEVIEIDTMTVNLVGEPGRYARVGFAVVLDATADNSIVGARVPLLRDMALTVLTDFTSAELQTAAGMERLRQALSDRSVGLFPDGEVIRAVLTELIVQ